MTDFRREEPQQAAEAIDDEAIDDSNIVNISGAPVNPPFQRLPTSATDPGFGPIPEVTGERFVSLGAKDDLPARRRIPNTALSNGTPAASGAPVGSSAKPDEGGSIPQNSSLLESCPFCTMSLAKRSGIGLFWQHPQSDCFFSNQRVTSGQAAAWNRRAASPVQANIPESFHCTSCEIEVPESDVVFCGRDDQDEPSSGMLHRACNHEVEKLYGPFPAALSTSPPVQTEPKEKI